MILGKYFLKCFLLDFYTDKISCKIIYHFRSCKKFGRQSWLIAMIIITEFLIVVKFDMETISKPLPQHIALFWIVGALGLVFFTFWKFFIYRDVKNDVLVDEKKEDNGVRNGNGKYKQSYVNGNGVAAKTRLRKAN